MLAQHFGLPTRLLDWSSSLAVAGYFSVFNEKHFEVAGAVWLLNPGVLNQSLAGRPNRLIDVGLADDDDVERLAEAGFRGRPHTEHVVAVQPPQTNERLAQQRGAFTLHGGPIPLEDRPLNDKYLAKIEIPAGAKAVVAEELSNLGVSRTGLFPDLENLARVIKESIKYGIESGAWDDAVDANRADALAAIASRTKPQP